MKRIIQIVKEALGFDSPPVDDIVKTGGHPRSVHWPVVRAAWLKSNPACAACGGKLEVEVHHKKPFHLFPELELDPKNFMSLCEHPSHSCHFTWGHGYNWMTYNKQVEGDVARWADTLVVIRRTTTR